MLNEKTAGRRMTRQRQAIMEMLAKTDEHPTAEMVYEAVRKQLPEISLGTVYRNLQLLVEEGLPGRLAEAGEARALMASWSSTAISFARPAGEFLTCRLVRLICRRICRVKCCGSAPTFSVFVRIACRRRLIKTESCNNKKL